MRFIRLLLIFTLLIDFIKPNDLEKFYVLLEQPNTIKLKIKFTQKQLGRVFESYGDFYILGPQKYFYNSHDLEIYANSDLIITKNYSSKQIIYNNIDKNNLNLMDVLSGNREYVKFLDKDVFSGKYNFSIYDLGFRGYFLFKSNSNHLDFVYLETGLNQFISIDVAKFEILEMYDPKIENEDFEVIDLRG